MLDDDAAEFKRPVGTERVAVVTKAKALSHGDDVKGGSVVWEVGSGIPLWSVSSPSYIPGLTPVLCSMPQTYLLISNPPHGEADAQLIAQEFGFTSAEALMRIHFPAPQVWFAGEDLDDIKRTGAALQDAGARVRIINGSLLSLIPAPDNLQAFSFDETRVAMKTNAGTDLDIPYHARVILVSSQLKRESQSPESQMGSSSSHDMREKLGAAVPMTVTSQGDSMAADLEEATDEEILDAYFISESRVQRATLRSGSVNYAGLESDATSSEEENRAALIARFTDRFRTTDLDERLKGAPAPKPYLVGGKGMPAILGAIDAGLQDMATVDLLSRLALLSRL